MNSGIQKLSTEATSGSRPAAAASSSLALCCSSAGITETRSCTPGCASAHSPNTSVKIRAMAGRAARCE
jgi:hypothetical protein